MNSNALFDKCKALQKTWPWSLLSYTALVFVIPYYGLRILFGEKYRLGLRHRLGFYSTEERERMRQGQFIWVHTVSVGELQAARPLLRSIKEHYSDYQIVVTTVTPTGQELAHKVEEIDASFYFPLDIPPLSRRFLAMAQPHTFFILETELWPNAIRAAAERSIPIFLINARLSDRSYGNYYKARRLFKPVLDLIDVILAQSQNDAERFAQLGVNQEHVHVSGNLKFESVAEIHPEERGRWRELFQLKEEEILLLAGSTFAGEEHLLAEVFLTLRKEGYPLRLLIAPRHIERVDGIVQVLRESGFSTQRRSTLAPSDNSIPPDAVLLLDTMGELRSVYAAADIVFIGKSLCNKGGQNPIEPAAWGKAIVFGEKMQNFRDVAELFLRAEGAKQVKDKKELQDVIKHWCESEGERKRFGEQARQVVEINQGSIQRVFEQITPYLSSLRKS